MGVDSTSPPPRERLVLLVVAAVQFVNILDFMIVMPLGPDFAGALRIPESNLGFVAGSYTAAAAVAGLLSSLFLDRFDRRPAIALAMCGLAVGTFGGAFATDLPSLVAARVVAGAFGGPASALSLSIVSDVVPPERRGKAMGFVMGAFSLASVVGVPAALELARRADWRMPFFAVAALGAVVTVAAQALLPPLRGHLTTGAARTPVSTLFTRPALLYSYAMAITAMMSTFVVVPNISAYVQGNLDFPRGHLGLLYLAGGVASLASNGLAGRLVDRFGSFRIGTFGSLGFALVIWVGFGAERAWIPVIAVFATMMIAASFRGVSFNALTSKVPLPSERARFLSVLSSMQHTGAAIGAFVSARLLTTRAGGGLDGMETVAGVSIVVAMALPLLLRAVETRVHAVGAS